MTYNFGVYHWRRRARTLVASALAVAVGARLFGRRGHIRRLLAAGLVLWGLDTGGDALSRLLRPPPWRPDREKYEALAAELPLGSANRLLDVGCGTGRSLVGLASRLPGDCTAVGVDVFDDRVILGNGPRLARRNAARAGLEAATVRGDAARLPVADDSVDVVTACRVLHDLPAEAAQRTLAEAHRTCKPDGAFGVLELPLPHDKSADPVAYWRDRVADAGFTVTTVRDIELERGRYIIVVAEP
ncbi:class I SAM-dependent methyltransferase [Halegenticoccus tardaugens]|uniref:class I SAM-dependent methyltransferase n=1 Tax=Halegenticoccus tardaugens TaxID=2071624 RepID=UPI00100B853C|nr:class I SAM-dependent methyltransferase [Halegenticoccus tardaugens]